MDGHTFAEFISILAKEYEAGRDPYKDERVEHWNNELSRWETAYDMDRFFCRCYRLKPRQITKTVSWPAPETEAPEVGTVYYAPRPDLNRGYQSYVWRGSDVDQRILKNGLVYLTADNAIARTNAMLGRES